jgi:hypothetical protein
MRRKTTPCQLEINRRKELALELRIQGLKFVEIADRISKEFNLQKYDRLRAREDVTRMIDQRRIAFDNRMGNLISIQLTQLEQETNQLLKDATTPEAVFTAVTLSMKISERSKNLRALDISTRRLAENKVNAELAYITDRLGELLPSDQYRDLLGALATIKTELAQQQQSLAKTSTKTARPKRP